MATNFIRDGKKMEMATVANAESGDAFVVGGYLPCVLLTDAGADPYKATVQTEGVFDLSVKGEDGNGNTAVSVGDLLYWTDKDTPLNKDSSEDPFGVALEEVTTGATATINVMLVPKAAIPGDVGTTDLEDASVTSAKIDAGVIQYAEKTFSAAQIKTLYSANSNKGLEIVDAPGAGKLIEFISASLWYDYDGSNAYDANTGLTFNVDDVAVSDTIGITFLEATADQLAIVQALSAEVIDAAADLLNKKLYLQEGSTNPTGSSTAAADQLLVKVAYRVHDFS